MFHLELQMDYDLDKVTGSLLEKLSENSLTSLTEDTSCLSF